MNTNVRLRMQGITKFYGEVAVLQDVDFELMPGEVHALVGENGAGKSTLIKILSGNVRADKGEIVLEGNSVAINSAATAHAYGITTVYQELSQSPQLSVAENVFMGRLPVNKLGMVRFKKLFEDTRELMKRIDIQIEPWMPLYRLSIAQRQMVEILKAISFNAKVIVFDEPTSSLSQEETDKLFSIVGSLKKQGISVIYISHRMAEIELLSDRVTVLRDGRIVGTLNTKDTTMAKVIEMMVGRDMSNLYPKEKASLGEEVLRVEHLNSATAKDISFSLRAGEILGFGGLVGAGRTEFIMSLIGMAPYSGKIIIEDKETKITKLSDSIRCGISYLTEDRKDLGIIPDFSIMKNITASTIDEHSNKLGFISHSREMDTGEQYYKKLNVSATTGLRTQIKNLSGGNQQKVMIARCLASKPKILILDEPTRGVDVGAKAEIYTIMSQLANSGVAIIMISSDMPELISMSDRIVVMCEGEISGEIGKDNICELEIMKLAARS